ncbi:MAG: ATP-dependent Clp protease ATP-binding subunit [Candidatus Pacebacteria bacterium]|nr:ATP-dependent Clp protease ATP-binding subunit [Candidatus Paceibacterota bacterium]
MNFEIKKTSIYRAIKWQRFFRFARPLKIIAWILFLLLVLWILFGYFVLDRDFNSFRHLGAWTALCFSLALLFGEAKSFFVKKLKNPSLKYPLKQALGNIEEFNWAGFLDFQAAKICLKAMNQANKHQGADIKDIFLFYLIKTRPLDVALVFQRGELNWRLLKANLKKEIGQVKNSAEADFAKIIIEAGKLALLGGRVKITAGDLLSAFAENSAVFESFLTQSDFRKDDIKNLVNWHYKAQERHERITCWWDYKNLMTRGSIGKDFASGYTITLDGFSFEWQDKISKNVFREIVGHIEEIKQVERILEKEQNKNVLLVGQPGTGRGSIIEAIAQRAFLGISAPSINYKRILQFDLSALVASAESKEQAEALLEKCFSEVIKAKNVILVINDFHNYVSENSQPGMINVAGIMARFLPLASFQIIAITTFEGFHTYVEKNSSFNNLFEKVDVAEISENETLVLMEQFVPFFEAKHKKYIGYRALKEILKTSSRYMAQTAFPEKALRLLDESMVYLKMYTKDKVLRPNHVRKVVSEKTKIPLETLEGTEKKVLINLENLLHERLIGQDEAVSEVANSLRRARAEVNLKSGPIGSFLFLGPTGVGKTETAKALAAIYFGSEQNMLRFDMSEFQAIEDIKRLIGTSQENGLLTTKIKERPFCLLLLDELEKAHPNILTLFLQVLDEGWLTDGLGRKVDFKNTIIIATSNAGAEFIRESVKRGGKINEMKEHIFNYVFQNHILKPEFVNRFDAVVLFKSLEKPELLQIAGLMLSRLAKNLLDKGVKFEVTKELKEKIVELSYSPEFGAREMKRVIQNKVENSLAKALLLGQLKRGKSVVVSPVDFSLTIR